jgi:penicillin-binding protein 2
VNVNHSPRVRLGIVGIAIVSLFAALFARLWYLQVMATKEFKTAAAALQTRTILEEAPRGRILDRNGTVLVDNRISVIVTVDAKKLGDIKKHSVAAYNGVVDRLAAEVTRYMPDQPIDHAFIERRLGDPRFSPYLPIPIADDVPKSLELYLAEHHDLFEDVVSVTQTTVRSYPLGRTASHVLGYVGAITQDELNSRSSSAKTYSLGDEIGKTGVERTYEDDLRGTPGRRTLEVDAKGNTVRELSNVPPSPGDDLYLTIDANVQAITEQSLHDELTNAHNRRNSDGSYNAAPAGASVIIDPNSGGVIAMASYPDYDPSEFTKPIPSDRWAQLNDPSNLFPLNNRALQGQYAPGSTFKLVTALAGLRTGAITPATTLNDTGVFHVPGCTGEQCVFKNSGGAGHGSVNLRRAITVSSDYFFYSLGSKFWTDRSTYGDPIQATAQDLGFGSLTGIPLPGEQTGFVYTPDTLKAIHDKYPADYPNGNWYTGNNIQLAIGQNVVAVTPLQLANAYAAVANGGTLYSPNIALKVQKPSGQVVRTIEPRVLHQVQLPPEVRDPLMQGFTGAVNSSEGTAYGAFRDFPGWTVAGKTGTAQVQGKTDTALFVGIAPEQLPAFVGSAVLEQSGFGATAAAPVIRRVFQSLADPTQAPTVGPGGVLSSPAPGLVDNANGAPD